MKAIIYRKPGHALMKPLIIDSEKGKKDFFHQLTMPGSISLLSDGDKETENLLTDRERFRKMPDKPPKVELFRALKLDHRVFHKTPRFMHCSYPDTGAFKRSFMPFFNLRYEPGMPPCVLILPASIFNGLSEDKKPKRFVKPPAASTSDMDPLVRKWLDTMENSEEMAGITAGFPGITPAASLIRALILKASAVNLPVLLLGETGTEKNRIASLIHNNADPKKPFVYANCAAITDQQFETEFFGQVLGKTGSSLSVDKGLFIKAEGGTLFLDEIGDLSMVGQARLLQALETGSYYPVGSSESRKCKFRIITATNSNLPLKMRLKSFREDLYYKLSSIQIVIPPLRDRTADIPGIANSFWAEISPEKPDLDDDFLTYLMKKSWPGNTRELRMVLENLAAIYDDYPPSRELVESLQKLRHDQGLFQRDELRDYYQSLQHEYKNRLAESLQIIRLIRVLLRPLINSDQSVIQNHQEIKSIRVAVDKQNNKLSRFLLDPLSFKDPELFDLIRCFRYDLDEVLKKLPTASESFSSVWKHQFEEPYDEILHKIFKLVWPDESQENQSEYPQRITEK